MILECFLTWELTKQWLWGKEESLFAHLRGLKYLAQPTDGRPGIGDPMSFAVLML